MSKATERYFQKMALPKGKTIIITGGNSGIGFAVARYLVRLRYHVILAVRCLQRGENAKATLLQETPYAKVSLMELNLAKKESIDAFIKNVRGAKVDVDVFYANAGIYRVPFQTLYGGLESHMAVNFAANYYLYKGLKDYFHGLDHPVKFVLTSSIVARGVDLKEGDLFGEKKYSKTRAYNKSKLAVNHLYRYMCDEEKKTNIIVLAVHPGVSYTPLIAKAYPGKRISVAARRFIRLFCHAPEKAALSTLRVLEYDIMKPCFCGPRGIGHISGYPKIYPLYSRNIKNYTEICTRLDTIL